MNGYRIISELEDVLESDYFKSPIGYDNVDWFVNEVIKMKNKMAFFFKTPRKISLWKRKIKKIIEIIIIVIFVKKNIEPDKVRDHCHFTNRCRGRAHNICFINDTQDKSNLFPFIFHKFSNYDCHMFFKKLVVKKTIK